jgi:hypothetical protein
VNPPDSITVMGQRLRIEPVPDVTYSVHRSAGEDGQGASNVYVGIIRYRPEGPDSSKDNERDTVTHELVHVLFRMGGYEHMLDHDHNDNGGEDLVAPLSTALLATLRANPDLVRYLLSE